MLRLRNHCPAAVASLRAQAAVASLRAQASRAGNPWITLSPHVALAQSLRPCRGDQREPGRRNE
jgi:hypothetical protein